MEGEQKQLPQQILKRHLFSVDDDQRYLKPPEIELGRLRYQLLEVWFMLMGFITIRSHTPATQQPNNTTNSPF